jgi:hypothetical protein
VFIIGIDPHKGSHMAAVIDRDEQLVSELSVQADRRQRDRLLRWAAPFSPRLWAVEGATPSPTCPLTQTGFALGRLCEFRSTRVHGRAAGAGGSQ